MDDIRFCTRYRIDRDFKIVSLAGGWKAFAADNDAPELADDSMIGRNLWEFITDPSTRTIYRSLVEQAFAGRMSEFDIRCDSPGVRRFMRMTIHQVDGDQVEFELRTVKIEQRPPQEFIRRDNFSPTGLIVSCSWCNRIKTARDRWDEVEDAVKKLHFFELEHPPSISHGICPDCSKRVTALYDGA